MDSLQILILSLIQGLTEFLPISSSAHLILAPLLFGYDDQGLAFDVAVHMGSLAAVIWYFRHDLIPIFRGMIQTAARTKSSPEGRLGWAVAFGTLPVMITGLLLKGWVETDMRSPMVIAITTVGFGLLLMGADLSARRERDEYSLNWKDVLMIGLFQAIALIPGTSRSGITMTAGLLLGLTRKASSRFSFLLAIPTITMSGGLVTLELVMSQSKVIWGDLLLGALLSFFAAYACIRLFLQFVEKMGMMPFVIYRLVLGGIILILAL